MAPRLPSYKQDFLEAAMAGGALSFGRFELKSKRISPYFFNAGAFHTARLAGAMASAFAQTILEARQQDGLRFDVVFGPAYKGIPLCSAISIKLAELDPSLADAISYAFDRKEAKDHGEGGQMVGAPLRGRRVLIVDDVVTAGTAKRDAVAKIRAQGGIVAGIVVALDRMEKLPPADGDDSKPGPSALGELRRQYGFPVFAILTLDDIVDGIKETASPEEMASMEDYRRQYRADDQPAA